MAVGRRDLSDSSHVLLRMFSGLVGEVAGSPPFSSWHLQGPSWAILVGNLCSEVGHHIQLAAVPPDAAVQFFGVLVVVQFRMVMPHWHCAVLVSQSVEIPEGTDARYLRKQEGLHMTARWF